jgi:hypothetical protein
MHICAYVHMCLSVSNCVCVCVCVGGGGGDGWVCFSVQEAHAASLANIQ